MARKDKSTGKRMTAEAEAKADTEEAKDTGGEIVGNARKFVRRPEDDKIVSVQFNTSWGSYNADEKAGFRAPKAKELIDAGVARLAGSAKYERPATKKAEAKVVENKRRGGASSRAAAKEAKAEARALSKGE